MHPIGGGAYLPMINALARAGHHVIYCNSRFRGTDSALLMEKVVEDLGECIKDAKNRLGYSKVVLAGWSGGGSLSVFYQQQAQHPTVTASPSGDGPDLTKLGLIPADGIMLLAAHVSRHGTMTEWLDASILDESDPSNTRPSWTCTTRTTRISRRTAPSSRALSRSSDRPQPANHQVGQGEARRTQGSRQARRRVRIRRARHHGRPALAGPDRRSERTQAGHLLSGRSSGGEQQPRRAGPVLHPAQLAVAVELRRRQRRRRQVRPRHRSARAGDRQPGRRRLHAQPYPPAVRGDRASDKEMHEIPGANHYYSGPDQRGTLRQAVGICTDWLHRHGFSL